MTTNAESTVKIGPAVAKIVGGICQFFPVFLPSFFAKIPQTPFVIFEVTGSKFT